MYDNISRVICVITKINKTFDRISIVHELVIILNCIKYTTIKILVGTRIF